MKKETADKLKEFINKKCRPAAGWVELDKIVDYVHQNFVERQELGRYANPDYYCEFCGEIIKNWQEDFRFCSPECKANSLT